MDCPTVFDSLPEIAKRDPQPVVWDNLRGVARAAAAVETVVKAKSAGLYVADNAGQAHRLFKELQLVSDGRIPVRLFPDREVLPYDPISPDVGVTSERIATLAELPALRGICVVSVDNLSQRLAPPSFIQSRVFELRVGDKLDFKRFARRLDENGYLNSGHVSAPGEYAIRGSLIDFFPPDAAHPIRVDMFDDTIESLRLFDPETQTSHAKVGHVRVLPACEAPLDEKSVTDFRRNFRATFDGAPEDSPVYHDISNGRIPEGIDFYAPLFFKEMATLFDYLDENTVIFHSEDWTAKLEQCGRQVRHRFEILGETRALLPPERLFADPGEILEKSRAYPLVELRSVNSPALRTHHAHTRLIRGLALNRGHASDPLANLRQFASELKGRVLFTAVSAGYLDRLVETLAEHGFKVRRVSGWLEFLACDDAMCVCPGEITNGAVFNRIKPRPLAVVSDCQVFGYEPQARRRARTPDAAAVIHDLNELEQGCPVVHEKHGVGRYGGLSTLEIGGMPSEFLVLEYADDDKLYVPVSALHLVSRYTGGDSKEAPLHSLGDARWDKAKRKARQKAYDIAVQLLDTRARRDMSQGVRFADDSGDYRRFCGQFAYDETPDQLTAMADIEKDMAASRPMDRILCGDVGFGKTELAMRAAFLAVHAGYQVVLLTPTTLLAHQHSQTFRTRFSEWPVRIEMLSRFNSRTEQKAILGGLKDGAVDIVVGTHRLLQKDVELKRPGLFIVDEEQRFGVRHKEKLKSLCVRMDMLTMTATPIPRTLNTSLSGLRDISIIATPPPHRHPVKTVLTQWDVGLLREACRRELHRGGQIYFLHNRVENIDEMRGQVEALAPEAAIRIAHGKMSGRELETTMHDFYRRRFDILLCTTIVENGLDIPSVNTIIIHQAERMGLAQLHQLRGRVGRAHRQAYAYMVVDRPLVALPRQAARRLETLDSLNELGVGFSLASHDLELRGAGELLGAAQSGHIHEVGFGMYHDMVQRAIESLRSGKAEDPEKPVNMGVEVNMGVPSLITEDYVPDAHLRLLLYRRLAQIKDRESLDDMHAEMIDRFGDMPEYTANLFRNTALKLRGLELGVVRMDIGARSGRFQFSERPKVDTERLLRMVSESPKRYAVEDESQFVFRIPMTTPEERYSTLNRLFNELSAA